MIINIVFFLLVETNKKKLEEKIEEKIEEKKY